jgi:hypothetical protein
MVYSTRFVIGQLRILMQWRLLKLSTIDLKINHNTKSGLYNPRTSPSPPTPLPSLGAAFLDLGFPPNKKAD